MRNKTRSGGAQNLCCRYNPVSTWTGQAGQYLLPILVSRSLSSSGWSGKPGDAISRAWKKGRERGAMRTTTN